MNGKVRFNVIWELLFWSFLNLEGVAVWPRLEYGWRHPQGRVTLPNRIGKNSKQPSTPPSFSENYVAIFFGKRSKAPYIMVQNLQYKFLYWKCPPPPPPLELFRKFIRLCSMTRPLGKTSRLQQALTVDFIASFASKNLKLLFQKVIKLTFCKVHCKNCFWLQL